MAFYHTNLVMLYGGGANLTTVNVNQIISPLNQGIAETVPVGSVRRTIGGPSANGHMSLQVFVDSAGGATSAITVWYSNLHTPSIANDNDWTQDTTIGAVDLTTTASKFINIGNIDPQWVMVKATTVTTSANIRVIARVEGVTHGIGVDL